MPDARLQVVIEAVDRTRAALSGAMSNLENYRRRLRSLTIVLSGFGLAATGAFAISIKAAKDAEVSQRRLDFALQQQGLSYANLRPEIEATLGSLRRNTNFGLTPMRDLLFRLINMTKYYTLALDALPAVLDVATTKNLDLNDAADLVAKALRGDRDALRELGIKMEEIAQPGGPAEILQAILGKYKGAAEGAKDPLIELKNALGEVATGIGTTTLPIMRDLAEVMKDVVEWYERWPKPLQDATAAILIAAGAVSILAAAIVGLALAFIILDIAAGPWLLAIAGIIAIVAAGIFVWKYWGTIVKWIIAVLKDFVNVLLLILTPIINFFNLIIAGLNLIIRGWNAFAKLVGKTPIDILPQLEFQIPKIPHRIEWGETAGPAPEELGGLRLPSLAALMGDVLEALRQAAKPQTIIIEIDGKQVAAAIGRRAEVQEQVRS